MIMLMIRKSNKCVWRTNTSIAVDNGILWVFKIWLRKTRKADFYCLGQTNIEPNGQS